MSKKKIKKRFKITEDSVILINPITPDELPDYGLSDWLELDRDAEAKYLNERVLAAANEANTLLRFSESASTNDIEKYLQTKQVSALAIALIAQIASARASIKAINARHDQPEGYRDKEKMALAKWATGDYESKDECADKIHNELGLAFRTVRNYLINAAEPKRKKRKPAK